MAKNTEAFWDQVRTSEAVQQAESWLEKASRTHDSWGRKRPDVLDPLTVRHSRRVAAASAILCFEAGLDPFITTSMAAGALMHDSGKRMHRIFSHTGKLNHSDPFTRYSHRRHSHDSWLDTHRVWPDAPHSSVPRFAKLFTLMHHTNFNDRSRNYPSDVELGTYIAAGDLSETETAAMRRWSPILTAADHFDALTHPDERPYMQDQLEAEGIDPTDHSAVLSRAADLAKRELRKPGHNLTIGHIAASLGYHRELIDQYGLAG